jgi:hypothetical protein
MDCEVEEQPEWLPRLRNSFNVTLMVPMVFRSGGINSKCQLSGRGILEGNELLVERKDTA